MTDGSDSIRIFDPFTMRDVVRVLDFKAKHPQEESDAVMWKALADFVDTVCGMIDAISEVT